MRLSAPALLIAGLFIAACSGNSTTTDGGAQTGACSSARDCATSDVAQCGNGKTCVCSNSMCVPVCSTNADCASPQVCIEAVCTNPGCGGNADCTSGQVCINGACGAATAASAIHSCVIAPQSATVHPGGTVQLSAIAQDSSGNALPFTGTAWSATGAATIDAASGLVTGGTTSGAATVTAKIGSVACTAPVAVYGAVTTGSLRVVVIDADTKLPISGAFVAMDTAATKATTTADGSATFQITAGSTHSVHAFAANHNYASYMAVTGTDLLIPLRQFYPIPQRAPFNGTMTTTDFASLDELTQIVHIAFFGSSIAGSILDFNLDDFLGQGRNVNVSVAGNSFNIPSAPEGLVLGLADDLFTSGADGGTAAETSTYSMYADPGPRALWGIGGNLDLSTLLTIATPIINGGTSNLNIGTLLPQVLPFLGHLEVGTVVGVNANASGSSPVGKTQNVTLDTHMHMNVAVKSPNLPKYNGQFLDGVIALTGAAAFPLGFTPLGLTAGLAATDSSGNKTGAITDPTCTASATVSCATNTLPLTMAPRNHGLESFPYGVVLVALNFSSLASGTGALALSGVVQTTNDIAFSGGTAAPTAVDLSATPFMKLPGSAGNVSYSKASRALSITGDADTATQIYKFTLQAGSHQAWSVYLPPAGASAATATLINPTDVNASLVDLQADSSGGTGYIEAIATNSSANNYASLTGFGNVTVDALGNSLKSFAVQTVTIGQ